MVVRDNKTQERWNDYPHRDASNCFEKSHPAAFNPVKRIALQITRFSIRTKPFNVPT